ncbi:hypothetical protein GCM10010503_37120 [Streptomyces lucensis JCM 4490]|uniref:Uncharacterized protein n=1 Tax=Streptomyces lucensis JCM 4490 TaxID=1306176 RepID=A0A918MR75_9ACTN|nr:hypothetical protein GCM10010503_37120 [Streptomyces lucensis JCM 4490]
MSFGPFRRGPDRAIRAISVNPELRPAPVILPPHYTDDVDGARVRHGPSVERSGAA